MSFGSTRKGKLINASIDPKFDSANSRYGNPVPDRRTYQACSSGLVNDKQKVRQSDGDSEQQQNPQVRIAACDGFHDGDGRIGNSRQLPARSAA